MSIYSWVNSRILLVIMIASFGFNIIQAQKSEGLVFELDESDITALLLAPEMNKVENLLAGSELTLLLPDNTRSKFYFFKNNVLSQEMSKLYPTMATLTGFTLGDKKRSINVVINEGKLHGFMHSAESLPIFIDIIESSNTKYRSYYGERLSSFECGTDQRGFRHIGPSSMRTSSNGATLKTYDIAVVITDEYEAQNGGGSAAIATAVNTISDMTAMYTNELAVAFTATVRPETSTFDIVWPGFSSASYGGTVVAAYFSISEYDLGHVFHYNPNGGSGQAGLGVVCNNAGTPPLKARAWSEAYTNTGYVFLSIVAHEVAHMFNATHTFNANHASFCGPSLWQPTSYEPGSGSTIMAYPGVCSDVVSGVPQVGQNLTDNLGNIYFNSSPYFHVASLEQMVAYINGSGNSCASTNSTGNTAPLSNANPCNLASITIPANTPFELVGEGTDSDALTYNWEQFDAGPAHGAPSVNCGGTSGPIFRSYEPSSSPKRTFPSLEYILNNQNVPISSVGECLPTANRTLNFKLTVRDNNANGGGIDVSSIVVNVSNSTGPLAVTSPNTNITIATGTSQTITWSGSNTSTICNTVNIKLSVDGGYTFPYVLASNTANDGSQTITLPSNMPGSTIARIKVESSCNECVKFFDISNVNFTITSSCVAPISSLCDISTLTLPIGDPGLNLDLLPIYGLAFTTKTLTTSGSILNVPFNTAPLSSGPTTTCSSANFGFNNKILKFYPTISGSYTFTMNVALPLALYEGNYNPSSPCTNIIGNTAFFVPPNSASFSNQMTVNLSSSCIEYTCVLFGFNQTANLTITGPNGTILYESNSPVPSYSYTYVAVNQNNGMIVAVNASSDFTSLSGGDYIIYGVTYYSGAGPNPATVVPSTWVGQLFADIQNADSCHAFSANSKLIHVLCNSVVTSQLNDGPGSLRDVYGCIAEGGTITFNTAMADTTYLTAPLIIDKSVTIDGVGGAVVHVDLTNSGFNGASSGINIQSPKSLTLKNTGVYQVLNNITKPVILNHGILVLDNVGISGSNIPIVTNNGIGNVELKNNVTLNQ